MSENQTIDDKALAKEGRIIYSATELNQGDILGIVHKRPEWGKPEYRDTRLYYVDRVDLEPHLKGITLPPTAHLKAPHLGVRFSDTLQLAYVYIHIPSPGEDAKHSWMPHPNQPLENMADKELVEDWFGKEDGNAYAIRQGTLYELGQLIPLVEVPSWSFMLQSKNQSDIYTVCEAVKQEFENAKAINLKIRQIFEEHQSTIDRIGREK